VKAIFTKSYDRIAKSDRIAPKRIAETAETADDRCKCGCIERKRRLDAPLAFDCGWKMTKVDYDRILGPMIRRHEYVRLIPARRKVDKRDRDRLIERIAAVLAEHSPMGAKSIAAALKVSTVDIEYPIKILMHRAAIVRLGHGKTSTYARAGAVVVQVDRVG
jgi:hypothetical protein